MAVDTCRWRTIRPIHPRRLVSPTGPPEPPQTAFFPVDKPECFSRTLFFRSDPPQTLTPTSRRPRTFRPICAGPGDMPTAVDGRNTARPIARSAQRTRRCSFGSRSATKRKCPPPWGGTEGHTRPAAPEAQQIRPYCTRTPCTRPREARRPSSVPQSVFSPRKRSWMHHG